MIVVTGAAGFISSYLVGFFNAKGIEDLILVDDFDREQKVPNFVNKKYKALLDRTELAEWFETEAAEEVKLVIHLGARTDTTEFDYNIHKELNLEYSKMVWGFCVSNKVPLIYASSAATYGLGEFGYDDKHEVVSGLKPLNPYGVSKNEFDIWALEQETEPPFWAGLKFFNVYGPNEYHKGRMASVVYHAFKQIEATGAMKLFRSHNPDYKDGEQLRDFVYVQDVAKVIDWLASAKPESGLYNLGSGKARPFNDLTKAVFNALNKEINISYIDTPADIRDKYQYFTEANMDKLHNAGYPHKMTSLEEGVEDYVKNYLAQDFKVY